MRIQRDRFKPMILHRTDYDGIAFPAGASSAEALAAVSFWLQEPEFRSVSRPVSERLYALLTVPDSRTGLAVRTLYRVTASGFELAYGGPLAAGDVTVSYNGLEAGQGVSENPLKAVAS